MASNSDLHLYTVQTPNGIKVSILLEELGLTYKVPYFTLAEIQVSVTVELIQSQTTKLDFSKNEQKVR